VIVVLDAVFDPAAAATVARQRSRHPAYRPAGRGQPGRDRSCWQEMEIADLLDAGADVVMVEMSTRELAARLKAPARRRLAAVPPGQALTNAPARTHSRRSAIVTITRVEWSRRHGDTWGGLVSVTLQRRSMMVEVGDRVLVESEKVGSVTRSGVVTAVDDPLITVRWDSGSESVFVPSAGSLRVTGHEPPAGQADSS